MSAVSSDAFNQTAIEVYDTVVVGGSWAGLSAAIQLARARRRVLVVDAGLPRNRFAHAAHGFLGQDGRSPATIMDTARSQVLAYPTAEFRHDEVTHARAVVGTRGDDPLGPIEFEIALGSREVVRARRIVLATGIVDELPDLPGLRERWGTTVVHCPYCHGYEVRDRRLGVLAVGAHSVHIALLLPDWSADVTLFTNRAVALTPEHRDALAARGVRVDERLVVALVGDAPVGVTSTLAGLNLEGGDIVALDALFTMPVRTRPGSPLAAQLGCAVDYGPFGAVLRVDARKATTVAGVYAAGDAANMAWNATTASADGVMAGAAAHQSLVVAPPPAAS